MKIAVAGMTPARLPARPLYSALPPPERSSARSPPPVVAVCSRVFMVSSGYSAARQQRPRQLPHALPGTGPVGDCLEWHALSIQLVTKTCSLLH